MVESRRPSVRAFLELFALAGFAVTQPVLDVFGQAPDLFIVEDASRSDIVLFALAVALVPAVVLFAIESAVRMASVRAGRMVHLGFLGLLVGLFAVQVLKKSDLVLGAGLVLASVVVATVAVAAFQRISGVRTWVRFTAVAPIAFVVLFLVSSPVGSLLSAGEAVAVEVGPVTNARSVVMVVFDEWPANSMINGAGQIDPELYPNLAALAGDGVWFRNNTTVANATTYAVPAMLTGRDPVADSQPIASAYPQNLFTLLAGSYDLEVTESVTRLCPSTLCDGDFVDDPDAAVSSTSQSAEDTTGVAPLLGEATDTYRQMVSPNDDDPTVGTQLLEQTQASPASTTTTTSGISTEDAVKQAEASVSQSGPGGFAGPPQQRPETFSTLVDSIEANEEPTLHFLHVQVPHTPYRFLPSGQSYGAGGSGPGADVLGDRSTEQYEVDYDRQRLLLQVGYVDTLVGELVTRLKTTGLYEDSVIVLTSDHGTAFVPGQSTRDITGPDPLPEDLYADILYTPLLIKGPGLDTGEVRDDNAMSIDVVPTIADMVGVEIPWDLDGISLRSATRDSTEKHFHKVGTNGGGGGFGGFGGGMDLGPAVTFDASVYGPKMLARNVDTLLRGDNPGHRLFDIAEHGDLVGRGTADIGVGAPSGLHAEIDDVDDLEANSTADGTVPAQVVGAIDSGLAQGQQVTVAVALNGVIAGVFPTWVDGAVRHRIGGILDPSLIAPGSNRVELFVVEGAGLTRTLSLVSIN